MQLANLFSQLKERHLYRVAVIYAAAAWLTLQIADIVAESFQWPTWIMQGLIVLLVLGLPLVLLFFWFSGEPEAVADELTENIDTTAGDDKPSLIVLPFNCFSDDPSDAWNADALTEDITTLLARFTDYRIIARNTAFAYKGRDIDVRTLKGELGVRYALEGSLRRQGGKLRVTAQLVETETGTHLWAENYDRNADEYDALYDALCQALVMKLGNELTRAEMQLSRTRPPGEWGVWELYQQARGVLQFEGWSQQSFTRVAELLRQALDKDPEFAPAQAYLSLMLALGYWTRLYPDRESAFAEALQTGEQAMAMAPESSEVLGYVGCALSDLGLHDRGIPILERAIDLNPSNSQAFAALGVAQIMSGDTEHGLEHLRHAMDISPFDPGLAPWSTMLSFTETFMGNTQDGLLAAQRACKADPRYFGGYLAMAIAQTRLDRPDDAQRSLDEAKRLNPDLSNKSASALIGEKAWEELGRAGITLKT